MSLLDQIKSELENMDVEKVREELAKEKARQAVQRERQKEYNASPEAQAKRKAYSERYREQVMADPEKREKVIARRNEYNSRPEVKEKRKEYQKARNQRIKLLMDRAKALGIDVESVEPASREAAPAEA